MDEEELQTQLLSEFGDYESESNESESEYVSKKSIVKKLGALVLVTFIWIQGIRSNSNLIYVPKEEQIYCCNGENKSYDAFRFRCYVKNCQSKIYVRNDGTAMREQCSNHNHGSMYLKHKEMECINLMKRLCLSAPASTTIREIYDHAVLEYVLFTLNHYYKTYISFVFTYVYVK